MKKLLLALTISLITITSYAQIGFLTPTGLDIEVQSVKIQRLYSRDITISDVLYKDALMNAETQIDVKITDTGCGLEKDSIISMKYDESGERNENKSVAFYLNQSDAEEHGCTFTSDIERFETITLPLVNGLKMGKDPSVDVIQTISLNSNATWGNKPVEVKIKVNQLKNQVEILK